MNERSKLLYEMWKAMSVWTSGIINSLSEVELQQRIAPGKNHGIWILGHLVESEDDLSLFIGTGELGFPEYEKTFGQGSKLLDVSEYPSSEVLKEQLKEVLMKNDLILSSFQDDELDKPH